MLSLRSFVVCSLLLLRLRVGLVWGAVGMLARLRVGLVLGALGLAFVLSAAGQEAPKGKAQVIPHHQDVPPGPALSPQEAMGKVLASSWWPVSRTL
jgi:hypothetical protein